jgi:mannose/fructose/N-acetylgalactosamine-specific phosphotransferase system component IIC
VATTSFELLRDGALLTLVGGVLALDRRGAFQVMVSQPLVLVPVLGLLMGQLETGLWLGAVVQLLWMASLIVGASVPPNETLAAAVIGGAVLLYGRHFGVVDETVNALAVLTGAPVAWLGRWLDIRLERENLTLCMRADEAARAGAPFALSRLPALGLLRTFLAESALIGLGIIVTVVALAVIRPLLGAPEVKAFEVVGFYVLPALGLAVAMTTVRRRRALLLSAGSFLLVLFGIRFLEGP